MKELKRTETTEVTYGYEAFDGTFFSSKEECQKYESSARGIIRQHALTTTLRDWVCDDLFGGYSYDDGIKVWFIEDENARQRVNQYLTLVESDAPLVSPAYIGHKVAVVVSDGNYYVNVLGTYNEILMDFTDRLNGLFADPAPANTSDPT